MKLPKLVKDFLVGALFLSTGIAVIAFIMWSLNSYPWVALSVFFGSVFIVMSISFGEIIRDEWNEWR